MIKDRIEFEKLYPTGVYANERYIIGGMLEEGDNIQDCYKQLRDEVEKSFVAMNPQINWNNERTEYLNMNVISGDVQQRDYKDERIQSFIATINMCSTKRFLENFQKRVTEENNPELTESFNNKLKTFE